MIFGREGMGLVAVALDTGVCAVPIMAARARTHCPGRALKRDEGKEEGKGRGAWPHQERVPAEVSVAAS